MKYILLLLAAQYAAAFTNTSLFQYKYISPKPTVLYSTAAFTKRTPKLIAIERLAERILEHHDLSFLRSDDFKRSWEPETDPSRMDPGEEEAKSKVKKNYDRKFGEDNEFIHKVSLEKIQKLKDALIADPKHLTWPENHRLKVVYHSHTKLDISIATVKFLDAFNQYPRLLVHGPIPKPTRVKKFSFIRSPHVDKRSFEQLEIRYYTRILYVDILPPEYVMKDEKSENINTSVADESFGMYDASKGGDPNAPIPETGQQLIGKELGMNLGEFKMPKTIFWDAWFEKKCQWKRYFDLLKTHKPPIPLLYTEREFERDERINLANELLSPELKLHAHIPVGGKVEILALTKEKLVKLRDDALRRKERDAHLPNNKLKPYIKIIYTHPH